MPYRMYFAILAAIFAVAVPAVAQDASPATAPATPQSFEGAETFIFRDVAPEPLRLHVVKPKDWVATEKRPAMVYFYGGGFVKGSPEKSIGWAKLAAKWGMVGIAPDYRVNDRFGGAPKDCVADARLAVRWVQEHADELGIDAEKVVVGGNSAGGTLALWTGITAPPPGSSESESPKFKPAALILMSALTDTTYGVYGRRAALGGIDGGLLSPQHHLDPKMPPTIMFHGDADKTVEHTQAENLDAKLRESGNISQLVNVPGGGHSFGTDLPEWKDKSRVMIRDFLVQQGLVKP